MRMGCHPLWNSMLFSCFFKKSGNEILNAIRKYFVICIEIDISRGSGYLILKKNHITGLTSFNYGN